VKAYGDVWHVRIRRDMDGTSVDLAPVDTLPIPASSAWRGVIFLKSSMVRPAFEWTSPSDSHCFKPRSFFVITHKIRSMTTLTPSLIELASWILATELMRRAPRLLRVVETHPGGGQYDCLSIVRTDLDHHLCVFNRLGSFTAFKRFDSGHDCWTQINVWDRIATGESTRSVLDEICTILHLPIPSPLPAATPFSLTYRVITAMLRIKTFSPVRWSCSNGFLDSSGFEGCGIRNDLFSAFPTVQVPLGSEKSKDSSLSRATDFWFFCCKDEPIICFEIAGRAYSTKGVMIELHPKYARRRSIYDVVAELHARFFEGASNLSL
jgi:hypothetical protein